MFKASVNFIDTDCHPLLDPEYNIKDKVMWPCVITLCSYRLWEDHLLEKIKTVQLVFML